MGVSLLRGSWVRGCRGGNFVDTEELFFYEKEEEMELEVELVFADSQI